MKLSGDIWGKTRMAVTTVGDRGAFAVFDMEQAPGSIATDLQVRGSLLGNVNILAKQEIV